VHKQANQSETMFHPWRTVTDAPPVTVVPATINESIPHLARLSSSPGLYEGS